MIFQTGDAVRLIVYKGKEPAVAKATYEFLEKGKEEGIGIPFADMPLNVIVEDITFMALVQFRGEDRLMDGLSVLDMIFRPRAVYTIEVTGVVK